MKTNDDYLLVYARKDSQRLKDTFFSDTKETAKRDNIVLFALIALVALSTIAGLILSRYDLLMVKRVSLEIPENSVRLMHNPSAAIELVDGKLEQKGALLYTALSPQTSATLKIDLQEAMDLHDKALVIFLRCERPVKIEAVLKDTRFFSNAMTPISVSTEPAANNDYTSASFDFSEYSDKKINLSSIQQITLYLHPKNDGTRIFVKDIAIVDKDSK